MTTATQQMQSLDVVLEEVRAERARQDEKWGEQNHPDGTGPESRPFHRTDINLDLRIGREVGHILRAKCERAFISGTGTWLDILLEEIGEAIAAAEPGRLRVELVQAAAVIVAWIETIDRRARQQNDIARELTFQLTEGGETYPFTEGESCDITGYGHQDKAAFADAINRYDRECGLILDPSEQWTADAIQHGWAVLLDDEVHMRMCAETEPGAFPVTTLWGQR